MALKDVARTAIEAIVPPTVAERRQRVEAARGGHVTAQQADDTAQAVKDASYGGDDEQAKLKAESDKSQTRLALERAAGRVAALERQLATAEAAEAAEALAAGRKALAGLKADREQHGRQIVAALDQLQESVQAFLAIEDAIIALPVAIRGDNASPGYNLGAGPLWRYLAVELRERGITGRPSSTSSGRLAEWLSIGTRTLP